MILVTGATGKIGSEAVRLLAAAGVKTRALVRDPAKAGAWSGIEIAKGDFDDPASVDAALAGVDTVLLLTAANPKQEIEVIDAAKRAGVKKIVKISALGADPGSRLHIGRGHAESEAHLAASGIAWTVLRPGAFTQNFLSFAGTIRAQGRFFASVKEGRVAFIDARDIAEAAVKVLVEPGHEGKTYLLTGSEAISYAEAAGKVAAVIGKPVTYVDVPIEETRKALLAAGLPEWLVGDLVLMQEITASGHGALTTGDVATLTGHPPRSFDDFARDYAASFK